MNNDSNAQQFATNLNVSIMVKIKLELNFHTQHGQANQTIIILIDCMK